MSRKPGSKGLAEHAFQHGNKPEPCFMALLKNKVVI